MSDTTIQSQAITLANGKNAVLLEIFGHLDEANVDRVAEEIYKLIESVEQGTSFLLDFEQVAFINSKGIGYLLDFFRKIGEKGGKMVLARIPDNVLDILEVVGVTKIVENYFTLDEAKLALTS